MKTIRMTMAQALLRFLSQQHVSFDGHEERFIEAMCVLFGHGIVCGVGQALDEEPGLFKVIQGKNEQGMAHVAASYAKQHNRRKIMPCASSIGPGAANMITAAATATVNNIPLLLLPGDAYAIRQPDPVLQQVEQPTNLGVTTNDAYKPVCKYWDRVSRPEQLMSAMLNAMRVLTDPADCGAVCVALPQDVQGEAYDYPEEFFQKRVYRIPRNIPDDAALEDAAALILTAKHPIVVCGGGVRYSEAGEALELFCEQFSIPFGETQAGKSACLSSHPLNLGGIGVTGNSAANTIAAKADVVIGVGTRFSDFTTASKSLFANPAARFVSINASRFHSLKLDSVSLVGDARATLIALSRLLSEKDYRSCYKNEIAEAKASWGAEMRALADYRYGDGFKPLVDNYDPRSIPEFVEACGGVVTQTSAIALIRDRIAADAIVVGASGSLPGCLQRMWTTDTRDAYNMEYGYSCMGYEIAGALGSKLAAPDREVYAMVGDGSYLMLHSELVTAVQEDVKIDVLLFDNSGFGCINNLQMEQGMDSNATEFRERTPSGLNGPLMIIDYAMSARAYGLVTYTVHTLDELDAALDDARRQTRSTLIDIKTLPKTMTHGYGAWWHVGIGGVSEKESVRAAHKRRNEGLGKARKY